MHCGINTSQPVPPLWLLFFIPTSPTTVVALFHPTIQLQTSCIMGSIYPIKFHYCPLWLLFFIPQCNCKPVALWDQSIPSSTPITSTNHDTKRIIMCTKFIKLYRELCFTIRALVKRGRMSHSFLSHSHCVYAYHQATTKDVMLPSATDPKMWKKCWVFLGFFLN